MDRKDHERLVGLATRCDDRTVNDLLPYPLRPMADPAWSEAFTGALQHYWEQSRLWRAADEGPEQDLYSRASSEAYRRLLAIPANNMAELAGKMRAFHMETVGFSTGNFTAWEVAALFVDAVVLAGYEPVDPEEEKPGSVVPFPTNDNRAPA